MSTYKFLKVEAGENIYMRRKLRQTSFCGVIVHVIMAYNGIYPSAWKLLRSPFASMSWGLCKVTTYQKDNY